MGGLALAVWILTGDAAANESLRVTIRWDKLAEALRPGTPLLSPEAWFPSAGGNTRSPSFDRSLAWRLSPKLSLIARDWSGAQPLVGRLALTDRLRLSRSSRMVISRVRFVEGNVVPFAQAGVGQWRVDTDLMPVMPRDIEPAGQFGGGFEVLVDSDATFGVEVDYTILYREQHEPQMVSSPHLWGGYFAARVVF